MNAPWSLSSRSIHGVAREPFTAFLCDDNTADALKPVVAELGWPTDKLFKGGIRNAIQTLSVSASPQILLVDLSEADDPLGDINSLAEVCEPGTVVLTVGKVNDVGFYRDLIASGIHDYLLKPVAPDYFRESLLSAQSIFLAPKASQSAEDKQKYLAVVLGARGGVGVSMVATSVAHILSHQARMKTVLLDLDIQFGIGALSFDLEPGRGMTDALESPSRIDSLLIERAMVRDHDNLAILSAEAPISTPILTDPAAFTQLQHELLQTFDVVVVDLPRRLAVQNPMIFGEATHVYLVTDLTLAGTRDTIRLLAFLKAVASNAKVIVVANKVPPMSDMEVSRRDFEVSIERPIDMVIPMETKTAVTAAKQGRPFFEATKGSKAGGALRALASRISQAADHDDDSSSTKNILSSKLQLLKGKMSKKK